MKPPEDPVQALVSQWIAKADEDLALAAHLNDENAPYLGAIGFHAQQAAEKYLKAFLVAHQREFSKIHDLDRLLDLVAVVDGSLAASLRELTSLTDFAVEARYPGDAPAPSVAEARKAVSLAQMTKQAVLGALRIQ